MGQPVVRLGVTKTVLAVLGRRTLIHIAYNLLQNMNELEDGQYESELNTPDGKPVNYDVSFLARDNAKATNVIELLCGTHAEEPWDVVEDTVHPNYKMIFIWFEL